MLEAVVLPTLMKGLNTDFAARFYKEWELDSSHSRRSIDERHFESVAPCCRAATDWHLGRRLPFWDWQSQQKAND